MSSQSNSPSKRDNNNNNNNNSDKLRLLTQACVRKARSSDYTSVVHGIGDVYNGRDWLPDKFHEFVEDSSDCSAFVIQLPGHGVVGFYTAQYLDGGRTVIKRAGRMHPDFRGLGLFRHLGEFLTEDARDRGTVERETIVALEVNAPRVHKLDYTFLNDVKFYQQEISVTDLPTIQSPECVNVHKMTSSDMELFFDTSEIWNKLVPSGFIWVESLPLRRFKDNVKNLVNHRSTCFMSFEGDQTQMDGVEGRDNEGGGILNDVTVSDLSMISIGQYYRIKNGIAYNMDFFSDNFDHLLPHVKCHIANMKSLGENRIYFLVGVSPHRKDFVDTKLKEIFSLFGIELEKDSIVNRFSIFEKNYT